MKSRTAYSIGLVATSVAHLALIPILSLYGVSVCPVLESRGFGFGCVYNGVFVAWILFANAVGMIAAFRMFERPARVATSLAVGLYGATFFAGTAGLMAFLSRLHVPDPTVSKMGTALFYTAVLLGVLHLTIIDWVATVWARSSERAGSDEISAEGERPARLLLSWAHGLLWELVPGMGALAIFGVFAYRMNARILEAGGDPTVPLAQSWKKLAVVALLLVLWLLAVRLFRLMLESRLLQDVRSHLAALSRLDGGHYSLRKAPGFWSHIFGGLNHATGVIAQRARLIKGFSSYVAQDVVSQVLGSDELKPEGRKCELTVLTSDLRDFTRMSNSLSAERIVRTLNIYFADMIEVFVAHNVQLDKFIGDGILAYVHPEGGDLRESNGRAVRVALAMHEKLARETNPRLEREGLPPLKLGVGVHAGPLVLGNIGAAAKMQYTIIGDTVNVASRLESFCKGLGVGVVVSREVFESLPSELQRDFRDLGEHEVRGIQKKLRLYGALSRSGEAAA